MWLRIPLEKSDADDDVVNGVTDGMVSSLTSVKRSKGNFVIRNNITVSLSYLSDYIMILHPLVLFAICFYFRSIEELRFMLMQPQSARMVGNGSILVNQICNIPEYQE